MESFKCAPYPAMMFLIRLWGCFFGMLSGMKQSQLRDEIVPPGNI